MTSLPCQCFVGADVIIGYTLRHIQHTALAASCDPNACAYQSRDGYCDG